ncbi:Translocation and assembly module subunit TamB [Vibrio stylophorae]|uniref:Translocation and assembly module subunit TamB n=1 Tax=Vibrio stylophorae TaxID=659351 RepID=A0ABN8DTV0_9VIBR|nr:Translocation and assembly module subunit TamB [Vibrio stylophorae]
MILKKLWRYVCRPVLCFCLFLLVLALFVIATPWGLSLGLWSAQKALPELSIESHQGSVLGGFSLTNIQFKDPELGVDFALAQFEFDWQAKSLLEGHLHVQRLAALGLQFAMAETNPQTPKTNQQSQAAQSAPEVEPSASLSLPITIAVDQLLLQDGDVKVPNTEIKWKKIETGAQLSDAQGVHVLPTVIDGLGIILTGYSDEPTQLPLPVIAVPFPIQLDDFAVRNIYVEEQIAKNKMRFVTLPNGRVSAAMQGSDINISQLLVESREYGDVSGHGNIRLAGDYPLDVQLKAQPNFTPFTKTKLTADVSGSLMKMAVSLRAKGELNAIAKASFEPFTEQFPFRLSLNSRQVSWPFTPVKGESATKVNDLQFTAGGNLNRYQLSLKGDVQYDDFPKVLVNAKGFGDLNQLTLKQGDFNLLDGTIAVQGKVDWRKQVNWQSTWQLSGLNIASWRPDWDGTLKGRLSIDGDIGSNGETHIDFKDVALNGRHRQLPLQLVGDAKLTVADEMRFDSDGLTLSHGPNKVLVKGYVTDQWRLTMSLNGPNLADSYPPLHGSVMGDVSIRGALKQPKIKTSLTGRNLIWQDEYRVAQVDVDGLYQGEKAQNKLTLRVVKVKADPIDIRQANLALTGNLAQHQLTLNMSGTPLATKLKLTGGYQDKTGWQGELASAEITTPLGPWLLDKATQIQWQQKKQQLSVSPHCWNHNDSSLCQVTAMELGEKGQFHFTMRDFNLVELEPYLSNDMALSGVLNADAKGAWLRGQTPQMTVSVDSPNGQFSQRYDDWLRVPWQNVQIEASVDHQKVATQWQLNLKDNGAISGVANFDSVDMARANIDGRLSLTPIQLDFLQPILGQRSLLSGQLSGDVQLAGPVLQPLVNGSIRLEKLAMKGDNSPVIVNQGDIDLNLQGQKADLRGKLQTPEGQLTLKGDASWPNLDTWQANLLVQGKDLEVAVPPEVSLRVSPNLTLTASPGKAHISGRIDVPWGRIQVEALPDSARGLSPDLVILNEQYQPISEDPAYTLNVTSDVLLSIGDDVRIEAFGLKGDLNGVLKIRQTTKKGPQINGEISINNGTYKSFGQDLMIRKGQILFSGPPEQPYLAIEAIRNPDNTEDDVIAGIKVTGPAEEPIAEVFSEPSMPQVNAISYLLRGRNLDSDSDANGMTTALISLGLAQSGKLVGQIGEAFGVQELALDTAGSGDDTQVTVSGYILPDLQLKYGVGIFNSLGEFTLRYRLMKDLYLEAVSGVDSAVDLLYQFEFN